MEEEEKKKLYLNHYNKENKNKVRGLMPFIDNDPSYKELYDKGMPLELVDEEMKNKYSFYEHTPYSTKEEYEWINKKLDIHYCFMLNLGIELMQHIAVSIGKDK